MKLSVVIPAYNEQEIITHTIEKVKSWLTNNFTEFEIIVVDDGSCDRTLAILKKIPQIKVLRNLRNHGKGYTVRKGVLASSGEKILFMDADNSTDITELNKLLKYIEDYPMVIGSRALTDSMIVVSQNKFKVLLGKTGNLLIRTLLGLDIQDTQCGFKLFDKKIKPIFAQLITTGWGFDFELVYLVHRQGIKIKEVPIIWENNQDSKVTMIGYLKTLLELIKIRIYYLFKKI